MLFHGEVRVNTSIAKEDNRWGDGSENHLDESEIELVKKASRAFAVSYVNEIYNTIKSLDPSLVKKLKIIDEYPYYLHIFIHQETPGKVEKLDIYSEPKMYGDGLCEVMEIYHNSEVGSSFLEEKKIRLAQKCMKWHWPSMEISKMYMMAISAGKRVGKSIFDYSQLSSTVSFRKQLHTSLQHCPGTYPRNAEP